MTTKQTDRSQIERFGRDGVELFNQIESLLKGLVAEMAGVNYRGQNALDFKTKCTQHAVDFSRSCSTSMQRMSEAISEATSFIATALGGSPISLEAPVMNVDLPNIDADVSVESAEAGPLISLRESVKSTCDQIESSFTQNLSNLQALGVDGWIGPEYDSALDQVVTLTNSVIEDVHNSRTVMMGDITGQLQVLGMDG